MKHFLIAEVGLRKESSLTQIWAGSHVRTQNSKPFGLQIRVYLHRGGLHNAVQPTTRPTEES
jgi:hypothetical protein